ncbi:MAG: DNA polymerase IV [Acidimicrobiales bacterium]
MREWDHHRLIMHVDLDCFFAAVEELDDPTLQGRPVVVGGTGARGVVAAANYEARIYGVHSAMSMAEARRRCPMAIFRDGNFRRYSELSRRFHELLDSVTPVVEPIGLDEAFLDCSGILRAWSSAMDLAEATRSRLMSELGLSLCVGIGTTRQIAKLASKRAKPHVMDGRLVQGLGVCVVQPGDERTFLGPVLVGDLWGVGSVTGKKLARLGVRNVGELLDLDPAIVFHALGSHGLSLLAALDGSAAVQVQGQSSNKSLGVEETYPKDLKDPGEIDREIVRLVDSVCFRLFQRELFARVVVLKIRTPDFQTHLRQQTLTVPTRSPRTFLATARALLKPELLSDGVRLLGVSTSGLTEVSVGQPRLDVSGDDERAHVLDETVGELKRRFGEGSIAPARLIEGRGVVVRSVGDRHWGPSAENGETAMGAPHNKKWRRDPDETHS